MADPIKHTWNGETHTVKEWMKITGLGETAIRRRVAQGQPIERKEREHGDFNNSDWWKLVNSIDTSTRYEKLDDDFDVTEYARRHKYGADD